MDNLLAYLFGFGPLALFFIGALLLPIVGVGAVLHRPVIPVLGYLSILFCFSQSTYGQLQAGSTIYTRGTGQLFFSFIVIALWGLALITVLHDRLKQVRPLESNIGGAFILLCLLFALHVVVAPVLDIPVVDALSSNGFINIIHAGILIFILLHAVDGRSSLKWMEWVVIGAGFGRAIYGLVRWAAFGGDPSNVYDNIEHIGVKLTYFDIGDNALAAVVLFISLRKLIGQWALLPKLIRLCLIVLPILELAVIVLSYRRTAWSGLALVLAFLFVLLPARGRFPALLMAPLLATPVVFAFAQRLASVTQGRGLIESFFYDLTAKNLFVPESSRSLELNLAFQAFLENPLFGVGAWGRYTGSSLIAWQTGPDANTFVHSSVLHLLFKTGLVGSAIVGFIIWRFILFIRTTRRELDDGDRCFFDASIAGLLFMIPDFLLGTPIPQFRTMQLYAILIAIPYLVVGVSRRSTVRFTK